MKDKTFKSIDETNCIQIALRCASNSKAYYQYEKITDENIIKKFKEIKATNGNYLQLQSMLKTTVPNSNWISWKYWNGYDSFNGMNGFGYTQSPVSVPESGLYYMWVYFSGEGLKNIYGYILVDNLEKDTPLESISLPEKEEIELGNTLTLTPTFNPENATNKTVTWTSSDESVATVDNNGKVTSKKIGSTIITVTSQDGNKKATCTVTVKEALAGIPLESISLPEKEEIELGNTLTLTPTFNPENATNKTVTWTSSDESVATVDNNGKVTSKKIGSTTITVASQDGNKKATCTVTVKETNNNGNTNSNDGTKAPGNLPQTGVYAISGIVFLLISLGIFSFIRYKKI